MTAQAIISRYNHLNGNKVSIETLRAFHNQVQKMLDAESHGPLSAQLSEVRSRLATALKKMRKAGVQDVEKLIVTPIRPAKVHKPVKVAIVGADQDDENEFIAGLDCDPQEAEGVALGFTKDGQQKIYDLVTDMILKAMKADGLFWRKPWNLQAFQNDTQAQNFVTKKVYKGVNFWITNYIVPGYGFKSIYFLTFKQVTDLGGKVKRGARPWPVLYYNFRYVVQVPERKTISEAEYLKMSKQERSDKGAIRIPVVQYYNVFNADQIEGIDFPRVEVRSIPEAERISSCERIVKDMPDAPPIRHGGDSAHYSHADYIQMPLMETFDQEQEYYSTLFHEMVHSTGHTKRLNRWAERTTFTKGSKEYAFEELIAELGASYIDAEAGILYFTLKNSAAYLRGWQSKLEDFVKGDNKFFLRAAAKAQAAADFILGTKKVAEEPPKTERKKKSSRPPVKRQVRSQATAEHSKKPATLSGFTSADEIPEEAAGTFTLPGPMGQLLGNIQPYKCEIVISGEPSSSKSELMKQLADAFCSHGESVGYIDWEHGGMRSKDTQAGMNRNVSPENRKKIQVGDPPRSLEAVKALAKNFKVIVMDSGTKLGLKTNEWIDELREQHPDNIWIIGMQQNAQGGTRGGSAAEFDSPIVIKTYRPDYSNPLNNYAEVHKNRNNPTGIYYNIADKKIIEKP